LSVAHLAVARDPSHYPKTGWLYACIANQHMWGPFSIYQQCPLLNLMIRASL